MLNPRDEHWNEILHKINLWKCLKLFDFVIYEYLQIFKLNSEVKKDYWKVELSPSHTFDLIWSDPFSASD